MKGISCFLIFFFLIYKPSHGQVVDVSSNGRRNVRAIEGGGELVKLDKITPLDSLVNRLDGRWDLVETGKAYWIGYTDDMYSIADYKDKAIQPLLDLYTRSTSGYTRTGVIFTLHLIGIESEIAGRFYERFKNKNARNALLKLCDDTTQLGLILALLGRDPWKTDLLRLAELLNKYTNKDLVNALFRYTPHDFPFRNDFPLSLDRIEVLFEDTGSKTKIGELSTIYRENWKSDDAEKGNAINNATTQLTPIGRVFRRLYVNRDATKKMNSLFACDSSEMAEGKCEKLNDLLSDLLDLSTRKISPFSYMGADNEFHHYVDDKIKLVICTWQVSRLRWLDYLKKKGY
jgi:hypothetical protein